MKKSLDIEFEKAVRLLALSLPKGMISMSRYLMNLGEWCNKNGLVK